ncbi:MAG: sialate O-acetylesterase [Opitutaceae bacterium]
MKWILCTLSLAFTASLSALELQLPSIFADQMVLQREQAVPVWGTADPGTSIGVKFAGQTKLVVADTDGTWRIDLSAMDASEEERTLLISAKLGSEQVSKEIQDVLVGEVWLAGGQSNMAFRLKQLSQNARDAKYQPVVEYIRNEVKTANDALIRQFTVVPSRSIFNPKTDIEGSWKPATPENLRELSGTAYFFARELRRELGVPVGIVYSNVGGTQVESWIPPVAFKSDSTLANLYDNELSKYRKAITAWDQAHEDAKHEKAYAEWETKKARGEKVSRAPRKRTPPSENPQAYGTLYNAMIHPIIPYAMKGVLWYQGESNTKHFPEPYGQRFETLINSWRVAWKQDKLDFYWCQLANYNDANEAPLGDDEKWPIIQNHQRLTLKLSNSGMAVLNDIGEAKDIHPRNKVDVGKRLSLWALAQSYGKEALVCSGPLYKEAKVVDEKVYIKFDHVGSGLMVGNKHLMDPTVEVDEPLKRFQICGSDGIWKWATAEIHSKDIVVVSNKDIPHPVEVRYAWSANPEGANLYNKEGLPASVFKTDNLGEKR